MQVIGQFCEYPFRTLSDITGELEICTVRTPILGADGVHRFAICDIDLLGVVQDVIDTEVHHTRKDFSIRLHVNKAGDLDIKSRNRKIKTTKGEMVVKVDNGDKNFKRKIQSIRGIELALRNKAILDADKEANKAKYKDHVENNKGESGELFKEHIEIGHAAMAFAKMLWVE